jgi:hypothetical protein
MVYPNVVILLIHPYKKNKKVYDLFRALKDSIPFMKFKSYTEHTSAGGTGCILRRVTFS